ncbi:MAG: hypothetical protein AAGC46_02470 [Solirubrobacteraceae bacterium]|nr:hypothetical protein [Patulibacter sp.]
MPPAVLDQLLLQGLALCAAAFVALRVRRTGRTVISHRGRVWPVVACSAVMAIALTANFDLDHTWLSYVASAVFAVAAGGLVLLSVDWDSYLSLPTQAAATWSTFGLWMLGADFVHAYSTGGAFWQPWNSLVWASQLLVGVFFAVLQLAAIRGARTRARRAHLAHAGLYPGVVSARTSA